MTASTKLDDHARPYRVKGRCPASMGSVFVLVTRSRTEWSELSPRDFVQLACKPNGRIRSAVYSPHQPRQEKEKKYIYIVASKREPIQCVGFFPHRMIVLGRETTRQSGMAITISCNRIFSSRSSKSTRIGWLGFFPSIINPPDFNIANVFL